LSIAKTAEPIQMPFGVWTGVGPRNHVLDGVRIPLPPWEGAILRGNVICTASGWLKEQDQQFFYNGRRALDNCRYKCISVAGNDVEKRQNMMYVL